MNAIEQMREAIRKGRNHEFGSGSSFYKEFDKAIDRLEAEYIELPKDRNGKIIHVGDTVINSDGKTIKTIVSMRVEQGGQWRFKAKDTEYGGIFSNKYPEWWTLVEPDTHDKIDYEIDELFKSFPEAHKIVLDLIKRDREISGDAS